MFNKDALEKEEMINYYLEVSFLSNINNVPEKFNVKCKYQRLPASIRKQVPRLYLCEDL